MSDEATPKKRPPVAAAPSKMPLVAAAVAFVALAAVLAVIKLRRAGETEVIESPVVAAPAKPAAPATPAPAQPAATTAPVSAQPIPPAAVARPATPAAVAPAAPAAADSARTEPREGDVFEGVVNGLGSRGDGRLRLRGKTVYVPGTKEGETVRYRIIQDNDRFLLGERVAAETPLTELAPAPKPAAETAAAAAAPPAVAPATDLPEGVLDGVVSKADAVVAGAEFSVVITDRDRFNPEKNGVCRIGGLVVIVEGVQPGPNRVRIRITERLERRANAVMVR